MLYPTDALPRKLATPAEAFAWWTSQDRLGRTYHNLSRMAARELKFVVDAVAPIAELEWSQGTVTHTLESFSGAYGMVRWA